ncbi:MAG: peptidylprolyl isomerase [Lachnospiraceae bacterium]|nr:peptidylprolyl isomerase [Lachnospiraceae bacterium]
MGIMKRSIILLLVFAVMLCGCSSDSLVPQTEPGFGKTVVRMGIKDLGSIDMRLFDNDSSEAYNLFVEKIRDGNYRGASVSSVIRDYLFMVRTAQIPSDLEVPDDMKTTSLFPTGPESDVYPIYGSVVVSDNFSVDGSFMIISGSKENLEEIEEMLQYNGVTLSEYLINAYGIKLTEEQLDIYREYGGAPWLHGVYPCIGQVFGGMELVERILKEVNIADSSYKPVEELVVSDIEIEE